MKKFLFKHKSDIGFALLIVVFLTTPAKEWLIRGFSFSPSVNDSVENLTTYNWSLKGIDGERLAFKDTQGKVVFVNFWATWCPPCRAEFPMLQSLYNDYKDKVIFIFVTNEDAKTVDDYFSKSGYNLPVYNSVSNPPAQFLEKNTIPASFLIDKKGQIVISKYGAADWNSTKTRKIIDELLQE